MQPKNRQRGQHSKWAHAARAPHLHDHVLPHGAVDEGRLAAVGLVREQRDVRVLRGERERRERVHDEVHPEQLQHVERLLLHKRANERDDERHDVDCQLELQELADVVEDGAAPQHSEHDALEVVVEDDNVGRLLRHLRACTRRHRIVRLRLSCCSGHGRTEKCSAPGVRQRTASLLLLPIGAQRCAQM